MIQNRLKTDIKEFAPAGIALIIYNLLTRYFFHAFCPMVIITGLPCPGCGMTRAVWYLMTGQLSRSFAMHPLAGLWLFLIFGWAFARYVKGRSGWEGRRRFQFCVIFVLAATVLLYIYRMYTIFPGRAPMAYTGDNILEHLIPRYRQSILHLFKLWHP